MSRETSRAWCTRENFAFSSPFAWRWSRDKRPDPNATRFDLSFNLVYLKIAKAASSTMGGVARRIAARHGLNGVSMFDECTALRLKTRSARVWLLISTQTRSEAL
jgi:hypothetical protein